MQERNSPGNLDSILHWFRAFDQVRTRRFRWSSDKDLTAISFASIMCIVLVSDVDEIPQKELNF